MDTSKINLNGLKKVALSDFSDEKIEYVKWTAENNFVRGVVYAIRNVSAGKKILNDTRIMIIKSDENYYGIWESQGLKKFFDMDLVGVEVAILYLETIILDSGKTFKRFDVFIND